MSRISRMWIAAALATASMAPAGAASAATTYYLSPTGSDSGAGTAAAPWRSLAKAESGVVAGDTVILRDGVYGARGTTTSLNKSGTATAPITFQGDPAGPRPTILGFVRIGGSDRRLRHLLFDGPTGTVKPLTTDIPDGEQVQVSIYGTTVYRTEIADDEIRNSGWHAGLFIAGGIDTRVIGNYIHDNGDPTDPIQANASHGIYFASGSGLIANNLIEHNVARGVQLYSAPANVSVANNTVVRNGRAGIQFGSATAASTAVNNIVAYNGDTGIRSASLTGIGNVVMNNLLLSNANPGKNQAGLVTSGTITTDPLFVGPTDYRVKLGSPAIDRALVTFAPLVDMFGTTRPLGAGPDLGAYEIS